MEKRKIKCVRVFNEALSYANGGDEAVFHHDEDNLQVAINKYGCLLVTAWEQALMTWTIEQVNKIIGTYRVELIRSASLADGNFLKSCQALGVRQPTADELRAAGLVTWE